MYPGEGYQNYTKIISSDGTGSLVFNKNNFNFKNISFENLSKPNLSNYILSGGINLHLLTLKKYSQEICALNLNLSYLDL